ncbi:MAG: AI-2E family transporter [Bacillota bacterium]|nr:AI-2E family transporter [Bacillota bacterium]
MVGMILLTFFIQKYFKPFLVIVFLLLVCSPITKMLNELKLFNSSFNALFSIVFVNCILFILLYFIGNLIINKFIVFMYHDFLNIEVILYKISSSTKISMEGINEKIHELYLSIMSSNAITKGAVYTTDGIVAYFIGNITAYFILSDKKIFIKYIQKIVSSDIIVMFINKINIIKKAILIEFILALITMLETILGFFILKINNALILGLFCGLLDILPYIGTIIVFLPLTIYMIITKNYFTCIGLLVLYILLTVSRQCMEVKFMSDNYGIHPLVMLLASYIGVSTFGMMGLLAGPVYVIIAKEIIFNT